MTMAIAATRQVLDTLEGREIAPLHRFPCEVVLRDSIARAQAAKAG
jgi:DNA-binding LacI/PurR family transcriptional regulator